MRLARFIRSNRLDLLLRKKHPAKIFHFIVKRMPRPYIKSSCSPLSSRLRQFVQWLKLKKALIQLALAQVTVMRTLMCKRCLPVVARVYLIIAL